MSRLVLAVLLTWSSFASAAQIVIDVSGTGSVNTLSAFAPNPPGFFVTPFGPGSTVTLENDDNGDGFQNDMRLVTSTLNIAGTMPLGALGSLSTDVVATVAGATGWRSGSQIYFYTPAELSASGTFSCSGAVCGLFELVPGQPYPIADLAPLTGATALTSTFIGVWRLDGSFTQIVSTNRATIELGGPAPPPGLGQPSQWYLFGADDSWIDYIPEPHLTLLVALGLAGAAAWRAGLP